MVRWVIRSILHGGPIELFLVPVNALQHVSQRTWYVLSCQWDGAYKRSLAANRNEQPMWQQRVSSTCYSNGPLPYVRRHITITKCVECVVK